MTVLDMHQAFKIEFDKLDSVNYPNILPEEIDFLLNKAQDRFVKQRYGTNNTKRQSFEEIQKRTDDLKALVKTAILTPLPSNSENIDPNAQFVELPIDYWFIIHERAQIGFTDCHNLQTQSTVNINVIKHDNFNNIIKNPFQKPSKSKVLRLMADNKTELIHSSDSVIVRYYLRYIKKPVRISISTPTDCELSDHTHDEIVNEAVSIALETLESLRTRTFDPIIKNQEE